MNTPPRSITLRFLAAPTEVATLGGSIQGGRILEWIDKAAYACAVGWSGGYCVTAYVGNIRFTRSIESGHLVEVEARLVHTGRSSMHIQCTVSSADPRTGEFTEASNCLVIFVAVDDSGKPKNVPAWLPVTAEDHAEADEAIMRIGLRADIEEAMSRQEYTDKGTAPVSVMRFLAAPTDVNWGGKTHGGTVMRWIDEAAYLCGTAWSGGPCVSVYAGGVRFYRPIQIGHVVEVDARLLHTGAQTMHISVHVRSGDPRTGEMNLTTHCLTVVAAIGEVGAATAVRQWIPQSDEDRGLEAHARELIALRARARIGALS
ncbi:MULTISPECIES: acyl-CoA thioesterase [Rhodococcus]|uniref:Acyl-CoA thioesterase n=1 Tax=Rhodococcus oxybenzonivorans TaxID=1990687 RepID=A0AAE4V234_9NOCA|nr:MULTISPECIES: acyl-CoA thioesterase [Rhodococcus]MDV7241359.1 acyl-CoA thioesterase [Rhodococcus oxybenzonivorans]MDV7266817.1 acyl-CoA thioesterase [Rhodococcus oxybenzonivorans]MDV7274108.1 acyl-CoA thioesterase [Rhodococcus oxybenzonivorans]MDV7333639.1 acyl-CoA thioesterase [Rhodococcus oxybenzonivorans]MDV7343059.1 acyl-CoA thioesterase [Rhodococcus oxybenzonivorans]